MSRRGGFRLVGWTLRTFITVIPFTIAAALASSAFSSGGQDFLPREIQGLGMGSDPAAVIERIKGSGSYTEEKVPKGPRFLTVLGLPTGDLMRRVILRDQKRTKLTWTPPPGSYYQTLTFMFTEKLRLYLIRFTLADSRRDGAKLKKSFFEKFEFPEETPMRITRTNADVLLYGPAKSEDFFFEFTDTRTGQKSFELFRSDISGQDRLRKPSPKTTAGRAPATEAGEPSVENASSEKGEAGQTGDGRSPSPSPGER